MMRNILRTSTIVIVGCGNDIKIICLHYWEDLFGISRKIVRSRFFFSSTKVKKK